MRNLPTLLFTLLLAFFIQVGTAEAQFKDKGPKNGQYGKWASKREYNGFKINSGQRKSLGLPRGLFNTGIAQNWKIFNNKKTASTPAMPKTKQSNQNQLSTIKEN
jgi:hypothetical protein